MSVKPVQSRVLTVAWVTAAALSMPAVAAAQRQAFVQGVAELAAAAEGNFGDEGPQVGRALDAMSRALDQWERQGGTVEGRLLEEVARGVPLIPLAAYRPGFEQIGRGELRAAMEELRRAASADALVTGAPSETRRLQGLVYWAESEPDKSIEQLEAAIRMHPGDERSRLALARVLSSTGRDADAERVLLDTLRAIPASARAHWW
ncbi:MAG TPA: tetratricopeptide repeat protein, partial [Candidatus Krumholzibacteria bacterium]|nr:tetratricopeptide repeat protein [Candidatus Krumholzibacteria bacterium]